MKNQNTIVRSFVLSYFIFLIIINTILGFGFYLNSNNYIDSQKATIRESITELGDIDPDFLCKLTHCKSIKISTDLKNPRLYKHITKGDQLKYYPFLEEDESKRIISCDNFTIYNNNTIKYTEDKYNITVVSYADQLFAQIIDSVIYINLSFSIIFFIMFTFNEIQKYKFRSLNVRTTNRSLQETNMQLLTENIHHELNTPLAIVGGLIKNIDIQLTSVGMKHSFDQIYTSLDQMRVVLERMSNFKQLKYSNGNKSLYDIISYSANSMSIFKFKNFEINIDESLKNYSSSKMENGDILNIVSQHLKNSLEAKSSRINIEGIYNNKENRISLYIVDDGTGIRDRMGQIPAKEDYSKIFDAYYSTKDKDGKPLYDDRLDSTTQHFIKLFIYLKMKFKIYLESVGSNNELRGIGLYLNRLHMREVGGDVILEETSEEGTVFNIRIPVKIKDN
jgi:signal transduction histidine kinase